MKLTVLLDNHTFIGQYYLGEPGVCYLIEDLGKKILFDVGYSGAFLQNADKMGISLLELDAVVLSHGHLDHTWGLAPLVQRFSEAIMQGFEYRVPHLVTHPYTFYSKKIKELKEAGSILSKDTLSQFFHLNLSTSPVQLTNRLVYLGEIERLNDFEAQKPFGTVNVNGEESEDNLIEDSALAYRTPDGLVIITGCSHSGICNIIEYACKVCGDHRIVDIIGGFHLQKPEESQLAGTLAYLETKAPNQVHACHCTDLASKIALSKVLELKEVGVGLTLEY